MRVILQNAGYKPEVIITQIKSAPSGTDFDVRMGEMADMWQSGIVDALNIWQTAVKVAVSDAMMTLTTDVIVHHRQPKECIEP